MSPAAESRPRRAPARTVVVSALLAVSLATCAGTALAAPSDPNHKFERIGWSIGNVAAVVRVPNTMRAIVVTKNGEIHRVVGDRLLDELMGTIPVSQSCDGDGVLGATWDTATNAALFVTYISAAPRKFTVARLDVNGDKVAAPVSLYQFPVPTSTGCTNLGGGITMGNDGRLLVGVGDMGNGPSAGQPSGLTGKIIRLEAWGTGGPAVDNPNPLSAMYSLGVRNPVRLATDSMTGNVWFIDVGPAANDELNWISGPSINFAWPRVSGPYGTTGFRDPAWTWTTSINPTGLIVNRGSNFGPQWSGDLIVTTASASMRRVHPTDLSDPINPVATQSTLFTPGTGDPGAMADSMMLADGYAYGITPSGEIYRLRADNGDAEEPSDIAAIVPTLVSKMSDGSLSIMTENETGNDKYGFYPGNLDSIYSHFSGPMSKASECTGTTGATQGCVDGINMPGSAWATIQLTASQVDAMPDKAYFVLSSLNNRTETAVGVDSNGQFRPGGNQTFGCPCPSGTVEGVENGDCADPWTLAYGKQAGAVIGPVTFDADWDCQVTLVDFSEDWCYWCHVLAPDLEQLQTDFRSRGFTLITLISENTAGGVATQATIDSWISQHPDSDNPLILDENRRVMQHWFGTGAPCPHCVDQNGDGVGDPCNGFPQSHVFDCDGVHVDVICGADPDGVREAVDAALISCGR